MINMCGLFRILWDCPKCDSGQGKGIFLRKLSIFTDSEV